MRLRTKWKLNSLLRATLWWPIEPQQPNENTTKPACHGLHSRTFIISFRVKIPENTQHNKHVIITSKRRFDVIITWLLRCVFAGIIHGEDLYYMTMPGQYMARSVRSRIPLRIMTMVSWTHQQQRYLRITNPESYELLNYNNGMYMSRNITPPHGHGRVRKTVADALAHGAKLAQGHLQPSWWLVAVGIDRLLVIGCVHTIRSDVIDWYDGRFVSLT